MMCDKSLCDDTQKERVSQRGIQKRKKEDVHLRFHFETKKNTFVELGRTQKKNKLLDRLISAVSSPFRDTTIRL